MLRPYPLTIGVVLLTAVCVADPPQQEKPPVAAAEQLIVNAYDVRDLLGDIPNLQGPSWKPIEQVIKESEAKKVTPADGLGPKTEEIDPQVRLDDMMDLIRSATGPDSWDPAKGRQLRGRAGSLIIGNTPAIHRRIETILERLRKQEQIRVTVRFVDLTDASIKEINEKNLWVATTDEQKVALLRLTGGTLCEAVSRTPNGMRANIAGFGTVTAPDALAAGEQKPARRFAVIGSVFPAALDDDECILMINSLVAQWQGPQKPDADTPITTTRFDVTWRIRGGSVALQPAGPRSPEGSDRGLYAVVQCGMLPPDERK